MKPWQLWAALVVVWKITCLTSSFYSCQDFYIYTDRHTDGQSEQQYIFFDRVYISTNTELPFTFLITGIKTWTNCDMLPVQQ